MAEDIKKTFIFSDQLKKVNASNKHHLRFRIATDDLSRTSAWSPFYELEGRAIEAVTGKCIDAGEVLNFTWGDANGRPEYDIFIATSTNGGSTYTSYIYHGTSPIHTYSIIQPAGINRVKFIVQVASYEQKLSAAIEVYPGTGTYTESFIVS
jgi:hypothetical protein